MKRVDVFPAVIRLAPPGTVEDFRTFMPDGDAPQGTRKLDRCRVAIVQGVLMVVVDSPEGPKLVFKERAEDTAHSGPVVHVLTESGKAVAFRKDANCGCGSRLRSWNPYGSIVMSSEDPQ